eukprot:CAMPEP_0201573932 /NCGR_PEP_ID=MMETSP0190_2-20130828/18061_1 /ASSEMBLY_ACC=CAM_ASM_000263 /TAXON_ID=37353 /ORGANISM="Rosalina sp." /LENGTH=214 /DNA_ID=CAMNT_0048001477 /DNA_START=155 /DNA_END=796 /DNA_ORIENTATION=-
MNSLEDVVQEQKQLTLDEGDEDGFDQEEEETIDNIRHRYSPSWYTPTKNDRDSAKIKIIKSDTLVSPKKRSTRNAFTFDASYGDYLEDNDNDNDEHRTIMSGRHKDKKKKSLIKKSRAYTTMDGGDSDEPSVSVSVSSSTSRVEVWKRSKILKDLDWIQDEQIIKIGKIRSSFFLGQLDKDLKFLISMNVMDYSLLIGMHFRKEMNFGSNDERW